MEWGFMAEQLHGSFTSPTLLPGTGWSSVKHTDTRVKQWRCVLMGHAPLLRSHVVLREHYPCDCNVLIVKFGGGEIMA